VYRSIKAIHAQIVDDTKGKTLFGYSDMKDKSKKNKSEEAKEVGLKIAELAKEHKIEAVVFDRNGYKYHGRVKALADGAREGGLKF
jgi:large subunit ribosomal protein L18